MVLDINDPAAVAARSAADQFHTLLSFWLAAIIYGMYLILFVSSLKITMRTKRSTWTFSSKIFFCATLIMLALITIWMGVSAHRFLYAFSPEWTRVSGGMLPIDYLRILTTTWDSYINVVITNILTWIADALMIYRCFIIWDRNFWVIIPSSLVLLLSLVSCSMTLAWFRDPSIFTFTQAKLLLDMTYPVNITQGCLTTGLITFKIWRSYSRSLSVGLYAGASGAGLLTVVRIVVESAMIFTVQQVILYILYYIDSPAQHVFHGTTVPSIGVVFTLLAIRAYGATHPDASSYASGPDMHGAAGAQTPWNACMGGPTAHGQQRMGTGSDRGAFRDDSPVTLTIPDTTIYSTNRGSEGDIEKGDLLARSDEVVVPYSKPV